jgi:LuxR family maltose regulon positive regulatory protein
MTIDQSHESRSARSVPSGELLSSLSAHASAEIRGAVARGEFREAFVAAITSRQLDVAVDVLRVGWFDLLRDDDGQQLRAVLEGLSGSELMSRPLLSLVLGLSYNVDGFRRTKALYYFGLAASGVRSHSETIAPAERALVLASESAAFRLLGRTQLSVVSARSAVRALDDIHEQRSALIGYLPRVYSQLGMSLYYGGHEAEALHVFSRGYSEAGASDRSGFSSLSMSAGIHALAGNLGEAGQYIALARQDRWTDEQRSMYSGTFYRLAEALLAVERFDTVEARKQLASTMNDRRTIEHWVAIAHVEALTGLVELDAADSLIGLDEFALTRGAEGRSRYARQRLSSVRSLLHLALGNYDAADRILHNDAGNTPQNHVDRARLALAADRSSVALKELRAAAGRPQSTRTLAEALSVEAAVGLRTGLGRRTSAVLLQLAAVLRRSGQRLALQLLPQRDLEAVVDALEKVGAADVLDHQPSAPLVPSLDRPALTPREYAVLRALARSGAVTAIAAELQVSTNTAKTHLKSLYRKLGVRNRNEALTAALHSHLISGADAE